MERLITVFTPTYNREACLQNCYNSLCRQDSYNFEWLIVDDGSTDKTADLVKEWQAHEVNFPIRYFYKENGDDLPYNIAHLITIDLWQISPRISVGIDVLSQAKKVHIESGLILPSYARYSNNTSSEVYDGFIVLNDLL